MELGAIVATDVDHAVTAEDLSNTTGARDVVMTAAHAEVTPVVQDWADVTLAGPVNSAALPAADLVSSLVPGGHPGGSPGGPPDVPPARPARLAVDVAHL